MDLDFPLILVTLTFITGIICLLDEIFWKKDREAEEQNNDTAKDELKSTAPWLIENSRSFFPVLAIVLVLRSFLIEPFQIPSGSMLPTLEVGDFILVNKFSYGVRLPVVGTKVLEVGDPQRGDIMVFKYPEDGKTNYIKRVVGLPGDHLKYQNKTLWINGEKVPEKLLVNLDVQRFEEQLGDVLHQTHKHTRRPNYGANGEWTVPEKSYFMMGDNRDNSNDSRFWGFVSDDLVVGKAFAIWMHWPTLLSIPSFSRVGEIH